MRITDTKSSVNDIYIHSFDEQFLNSSKKDRTSFSLFSFLSVILLVFFSILPIFIVYLYRSDNINLLFNRFDSVDVPVDIQNLQKENEEAAHGKSEIHSDRVKRKIRSDTLSYLSKDEIKSLGVVDLPEGFVVQDEYKGFKFVGTPGHMFEPHHLKLLKYFIDITPTRLLELGPAAIVMRDRSTLPRFISINDEVIAFASGPYVFFDKKTFNPSNPLADSSVDYWYYTFIHEVTHVAQFSIILEENPNIIREARIKGLSWLELVSSSLFIRRFAERVGWEYEIVNGVYQYRLKDPDNSLTTDYGKSKVYEDMAESVASVVTDSVNKISQERIQWVYEFLGVSEVSDIQMHKIPIYEYAQPVLISNVEYDFSKHEEFRNLYEYTDKQVFLTYKKYNNQPFVNLVDKIVNDIKKRGWQGSVVRSRDADGVLRFKGFFDGVYRDFYIELISYQYAKGYERVPDGFVIVMLSGYISK